MSGYQKALKVIAIIEIVIAVLCIGLGILFFAAVGSGDPALSDTVDIEGQAYSFGAVGVIGGGFMIVIGIFELITGILGVRGANNPSKIGPFYVLAGFCLGLSIVELILAFVSLAQGTADGSTVSSGIFSVVINAVCVWLAAKIKKQA